MNKVISCIIDGVIAALKAPLFIVILVAMVISAMRHPPGRLAPAKLRKQSIR